MRTSIRTSPSRRVLITGGSGFVGANLARRLARDGHEVHALLRPARNRWRLEAFPGRLIVHAGTVADRPGTTALVRDVRPQWIFHLAAHGAYPEQRDLEAMIQTNIMGAVNLIDASADAGVEAFINAGSSSEYGFKDHAPSESEVLEPSSDYAFTKASATLYCQSVAKRTGLPAVTLRLYSVYGPYEQPTRLIPTLIRMGLEKRLPPLVNPEIARDYVYVDDVSDAFVLAAESAGAHKGAIYNLGSGRQTTLSEVVEVVRELLGISARPHWRSMAPRSWDTSTWVADPSLIRSELGWTPTTPLSQGLERTIAWTKQNLELVQQWTAPE